VVKLKPAVKKAHEQLEDDPEGALAACDRVLAKDPTDSMAHWVRGLALAFYLDRPKEAHASLERAYRDVVKNFYFAPEVHTSFAKCLSALGEFEAAREVLDGCLSVYPDDLDAWLDRGNLSKDEGKIDAALADVDEVLSRQPKNPLALYNRACFLALLGKKDEALAALKRSIAVSPDDADAAREDDDFRTLRKDKRFIALVK
jgi:tetratricopeptide (TPR) repeat protein